MRSPPPMRKTCRQTEGRQGYSPDGLERCSHIAEVIGSSPIVPTPIRKAELLTLSQLGFLIFQAYQRCCLKQASQINRHHIHANSSSLPANLKKKGRTAQLTTIARRLYKGTPMLEDGSAR